MCLNAANDQREGPSRHRIRHKRRPRHHRAVSALSSVLSLRLPSVVPKHTGAAEPCRACRELLSTGRRGEEVFLGVLVTLRQTLTCRQLGLLVLGSNACGNVSTVLGSVFQSVSNTHREGSWTRSLRLTPLRSSARFRKQLSLTGWKETDRRTRS